MFKNIKSLFIIEEEKEKKSDEPKKENPQPVNEAQPNVKVKFTGDQKALDKLINAVEKNNLEGFDYLEFKKALKALEKMPMDEATKFRSAFATASTLGVTLEKLTKTVKFYLGILNKENQEFLANFRTKYADFTSKNKKELVKVEALIKEKTEKINQLNQQVKTHQEQIAELKQKLEQGNAKMQQTEINSQNAFDYLKSQFENDLLKMQDYLK